METLEFRQSSLRDFLHVIFKRKNQILLFFIITVCTVAIGTFVIQPTYEAKAQILVKMGRENLYIPPNSTNSQMINFNRDNQINSEIELLKGQSLAEKVIRSLGSETIYENMDHEDTVLKFLKSLSVEGIKKSDVIEVSFKHNDPKMAAKIVNTLANAYLDEHLLVHKNPQSFNFFEDQSQVLKTKLEQSEAAIETFKKQNLVTDLGEQQKLLLKQIADLNTELNRTLSQEAETRDRVLQIRQQLDKTPENVPQGKEVDHNPYMISNLEAKLVELQLKEKELLLKYTPQSRLVSNVKEEIQMVQEKLVQNEKKQYGTSRVGLNTTYQRIQEELFRNQAEIKALAAKREIQTTQLTDSQSKLEQLNQMDVKLTQLEQSVDVNRQNYRLYLAKFEESRISDAMDNKKMANVSIMQSAFTPLKPISPKKLLNLVLALFLGGFGGLGLAFFGEYLDDSLEKPEDVEQSLQLPVLASIIMSETKPHKRLLKLMTAVIVVGVLIFVGSLLLNKRGFQFANLTGFLGKTKGPGVETDLPVTIKQKEQISQTEITQKINIQTSENNNEAEARVKNDEGLSLTVYRHNPLNENDHAENPADDEEKSSLTVPVKEEVITRNVVVKEGETLFRIIFQAYGAYDEVILKKVQEQNPKIIAPELISAGQIIKLPVDPEDRGRRSEDGD